VSTLRKWSAGDAVMVCTASGFEGGESQALGEVQGSTVGIPPSWLGRFAPAMTYMVLPTVAATSPCRGVGGDEIHFPSAMSYISTLRWIEPPIRIELTTARLQDR
jgi:hypothetical protein